MIPKDLFDDIVEILSDDEKIISTYPHLAKCITVRFESSGVILIKNCRIIISNFRTFVKTKRHTGFFLYHSKSYLSDVEGSVMKIRYKVYPKDRWLLVSKFNSITRNKLNALIKGSTLDYFEPIGSFRLIIPSLNFRSLILISQSLSSSINSEKLARGLEGRRFHPSVELFRLLNLKKRNKLYLIKI